MDKHTQTPKWAIDSVKPKGNVILSEDGVWAAMVTGEDRANRVVSAMNERSALLKVEEALRALRQINWRLQKESVGEAECMAVEQQVEAALSQLEEVRHGK